uniref:Translation initiation factor eIF2B subunit alpha n=1 Tax=Ciona savignyi TaxID=51511 RepID=H2YWQ4_CIOSA
NMDDAEVAAFFKEKLKNDKVSSAVAAIETLLQYIRKDTTETISGLIDNQKQAISVLEKTDCLASTSVSSGADLFLRFITLASLEHHEISDVKKILINRGELFLRKVSTCRQKIANLGVPFIKDGAVILTHSYSRVVACVLKQAAESKKRFTVYVTQSCPDKSGFEMAEKLRGYSIPVVTILDAAAGYILEKVDVVLVGAEGVVENGGIINKIGSYQLGLCAKALNKPVYVFAESFKFVRLYPLNQHDLPDHYKYKASVLKDSNVDLREEHPIVDYTPPSLISLLITDLGVLTPSAVSDELIKLYL